MRAALCSAGGLVDLSDVLRLHARNTGHVKAARKPKPKMNAGLSDLDRASMNGTRLEIPLADAVSLRQVADLIRGFAAELDFWSRRTDVSEREILAHVARRARELNTRMRQKVYGSSKRRDRFEWERK